MPLWKLNGAEPQCAENVFIAPGAQVVGKVTLERHVSVWFNAVIRADNEPMHIGANSNIQDAAVLHSDPGYPLTIGENVTVGHQATLHGCTIGDGALIGIGAVVLNGARIGRNCLVAAGAVVTEGKIFPDNSLIVGAPAQIKRELTAEAIQGLHANAAHYVANGSRYTSHLEATGKTIIQS